MRKWSSFILAIVLCFSILAGCSSGIDSKEKDGAKSTKSSNSGSSSEKSSESDTKKTTKKEVTSKKPESTKKSSDEPLDCDWTLQVDQTIPVKTDGMTVNYTLILNAKKEGGKDVLGNYTGTAHLEISLDASSLSNEVMQVSGGFNVKASTDSLQLQVVPYDIEAYTSYGLGEGEPPLAPLVQYEAMALVSPQMQGTGVLNPTVQGVQGEKAEVNESASDTLAMPMRITINSGQVQVYIPSLKLAKSFNGMLLGTPLNSK